MIASERARTVRELGDAAEWHSHRVGRGILAAGMRGNSSGRTIVPTGGDFRRLGLPVRTRITERLGSHDSTASSVHAVSAIASRMVLGSPAPSVVLEEVLHFRRQNFACCAWIAR